MPSEHARLSPSSAHRWIACPSSLSECERNAPPENKKSNKYQEEGTAAHELAERVFSESLYDAIELEGDMAKNGMLFSAEMCEFVNKYIKAVRGFSDGHTLYVEERVDFSTTIGVPDSFGTADAIVLTQDGVELQLHDLKYGMGVQVYAANNEQLMLYALGALRKFDPLGDIGLVRLVIHQPRLNHIDEWVISVPALLAFGVKAKAAAAKAIDLADKPEANALLSSMNPGAKQCKFCAIKATCPARLAVAADAMQVDMQDLLNGGKEVVGEAIRRTAQLDNGELAALLPKLDSIVDWTKAVRARVESELLAGKDVPGYKLVEGKRGSRSWTDEAKVEGILRDEFKLAQHDMFKMTLQSPTALEKVLKNTTLGWERMNQFITQADGKPSVAPLSDKRPALKLNADLSALVDTTDDSET